MNKDNVIAAMRKQAAIQKTAEGWLNLAAPAMKLYTFLQLAMLAGTGGALGYGAAKLTAPKTTDN